MNSQDLSNLQEAYLEVYTPERLDEISQKLATKVYARRAADAIEYQTIDDDEADKSEKKANKTLKRITRKHGDLAGKHAERAGDAQTWGRSSMSSNPNAQNKTKRTQQEQVDLYDIILSHLLDEELTGDRKKRALEIIGKSKYLGPNETQLSRMISSIEGSDSNLKMRRTRGMPTKRGGGGMRGERKTGKGSAWNADRGEGNKANRRAAELNKEDLDLYDIILSHLLDEGYADTPEAAEAIIVSMSEEWREEIVEAYVPYEGGRPQEKLRRKQEKLADRWGSPGVEKRFHRMGAVDSQMTNPEQKKYRETVNTQRDLAVKRRGSNP